MYKAGVMGWPISHSLSPRLHEFWLQKYGIEGRYDAWAVAPSDLTTTLRGLSAQGFRGVNLTVPHKVPACSIVDRLEPMARHMGAVNLVTVEPDEQLLGRNTDAYGFKQSLILGGFKSSKGTALILGAGGACRAVIVSLIDVGCGEILIANRTTDRAEKLAWEFSLPECKITAVDWGDVSSMLHGVELLVNTTSLGMTGQPPLELSLDTLRVSAFVADVVYTPLQTDLLRRAATRGHKVIDGLGMLLHQARPSFEAFFGRDPEVTDELRRYVLAGGK